MLALHSDHLYILEKYYKPFYIPAIYKMVDNSNSHVCAPLFVQTSIFESAYMMDSTKLSNHHGNPIVTRSGFNGHSATTFCIWVFMQIKGAQICESKLSTIL
jgi:hypothetical protein